MTDTNLIPFSFEGAEIRVLDQTGEPWWVLTDVCKVLDIANAGNASARLDDDEKSTIQITDSGNLNADRTIINESGLWSLVLTSRKPAAKRFKKWITAEVIPSIRKTGGYMVAAKEETPEELALRAVTVLKATLERQKEEARVEIERQKALIDGYAPKAAALDRISASGGEFGLTETAKMIQVKPGKFFDWLDQNRCRYPRGKSKLAYQERIDSGYLKNKANPYFDANGEPQVGNTIKVTAKGLAWFARVVPGADLDPAYAHLIKETPVPFAKVPEATS
ncbi:phage antirepressor [Neokomagataea sp. TBRC 2177]|uniref:Phage antirepressor n=1 Tax=Neokomagataea anthophila TaxID=2826925 RepID=A0ABS5E7Z7_9PROT|nr:phage antirepressor [Neokomagataea anthophila]